MTKQSPAITNLKKGDCFVPRKDVKKADRINGRTRVPGSRSGVDCATGDNSSNIAKSIKKIYKDCLIINYLDAKSCVQ